MKLKHIALAAALAALSAGPVWAADQSVDLSSGSASFIGTAPLLDGGNDVISFANLAAGTYNFLLTLSAQNISGLALSVNGLAGNVSNNSWPGFGTFSFGGVFGSSNAPLVLTVTGTPQARALYSGDMTVTAVPEPGGFALALAGLGVLGVALARRRT